MKYLSRNWPILLLAISFTLAGCKNDPVSNERVKTPNFQLSGVSGETFKLSDYQGKVVVLNFFETTCPICRDEVPELKATFEKHKENGLIIAAISMENIESLKPYAESLGIPYPVLSDSDGRVTLVGYGISQVPTFYVIDREGWIDRAFVGSPTRADWDQILEPLL